MKIDSSFFLDLDSIWHLIRGCEPLMMQLMRLLLNVQFHYGTDRHNSEVTKSHPEGEGNMKF